MLMSKDVRRLHATKIGDISIKPASSSKFQDVLSDMRPVQWLDSADDRALIPRCDMPFSPTSSTSRVGTSASISASSAAPESLKFALTIETETRFWFSLKPAANVLTCGMKGVACV